MQSSEVYEIRRFPMRRTGIALPKEYYEAQRSGRLAKAHMFDGRAVWLATRYEHVKAILSDSRISASGKAEGYPYLSATRGDQLKSEQPQALLRMDAPDHTKFRRFLTPSFTIKLIREMRPFMEEVVDETIDEITRDGAKGCDLMQDFALKVPTKVATRFLGVPYEDHEFFQTALRPKNDLAASRETQIAADKSMRQYFSDLFDKCERDGSPRDTVIGRVLADYVATGEIDREEAIVLMDLLLQAGHDTTAHVIVFGALLLILYPEQKQRLLADETLVASAVEEILRFSSIVQFNAARAVNEDMEVGGQVLKKGEGVIALTNIANRDPEIFPDPDTFDIARNPRHHLAFSYGAHQCFGQQVARQELQVIFGKLFQRLPALDLAVPFDEVEFKQESLTFGPDHLPVRWA